MVLACRAAGLVAEGIEPSRALVATARSRSGLELIEGILPHPAIQLASYDIVTLIDVIEHVTDPVEVLRNAAACLAPGGVLFVVTPDLGSLTARTMGWRWWHYRMAHIGYFNFASFAIAAKRAGLDVAATFRPKWFFPVRYLAERSAAYLPVGPINRLAERVRFLRWAYDRVIPLNLHDSLTFVLRART